MTFLSRWRDAIAHWRDSIGHTDDSGWKKILVPGLARPYSRRAVKLACRLAQASGAQLYLAYMLEVPRAFMLDASMPEAECIAGDILADAEQVAEAFNIHPISMVHRVRNPMEGILKLISEEQFDLLVIGARPDETRGLPREFSRDLALAARCEVIIDYIADEQ
jgi:nucleotide-binding universal stress UspA family protein